ncbi:hemolysin III family protein [Nanchangia anserum]|uniref:Hemolysin III family protein n=1 Tax=Nanchangia anserum TaxID=2692125 RepID=A0A8I0GBY7_9ACTO|nr:hemolysin III family protein [Nanchangia anserum]MBD3689968.1 hemolysin III family protein [Nanchangia anserum]QOX82226.1 hemolysin III family protein [Nanchangia anserum]
MSSTAPTYTSSTPTSLPLTKPLLRGWIHLGVTPLALAASIVLTALAPTSSTRLASAVFLVCSLLLFGVSALYHRVNWSPRAHTVLRRLDHSNIFLLIAGTYTPISIGVLRPHDATVLLSVIWIGAAAGIALSLGWPNAPRWLYVPIYIVLGWMALFYMAELVTRGGWAMVWLLIAGGLCYTLGAVVYGFKRPNPWPRVFGFHEIFHLGTVAGWVCCCIAAYMAVL